MGNINLICFNQKKYKPKWNSGDIINSSFSIKSINSNIIKNKKKADWILFWDYRIGLPDEKYINNLTNQIGDVFHLGLLFGLGDLPISLNYLRPNWLLILNSGKNIKSISWRLTPQACLIKTDLFKKMESFIQNYEDINYSFLDFGFNLIKQGFVPRYSPGMIYEKKEFKKIIHSEFDELIFIKNNFSTKWYYWVLFRKILTNQLKVLDFIRTLKLKKVFKNKIKLNNNLVDSYSLDNKKTKFINNISIIIPTLYRYNYLLRLLKQINNQNILPNQVIIIDQTPIDYRENINKSQFDKLDIVMIYLNKMGQSTARNEGIKICKTDYVLFCDDDIEIKNNFIENHIENSIPNNDTISCGTAIESDINKLYYKNSYRRIAEGFAGGNSLIPIKFFLKTGLFDVAFDKGMRADRDLGIRLFLNGYTIILDPSIVVLHHRANKGGLRHHNQRKITFYGSRQSIIKLHIPSVSDFYISKRYFSDIQNKEMYWLAILGTFAYHGNKISFIFQTLYSFFCIPKTIWTINQRIAKAKQLLQTYPKIPTFYKIDE